MPLSRGRRTTALVLLGCTVWLAVLGWIDRITGFELGLFAFYTAPVVVVAWNLGQAPGIVTAILASIIWYAADRLAGDRYSSAFYAYWNTGMHFSTFIINAVSFAKLRSHLDRRHELERALGKAEERLKQLAGLMPVCPKCRCVHATDQVRARAEECLARVPAALLAGAVCDDCRAKDGAGDSPAR